MTGHAARVLVVEDDRAIARMLERGRRVAGHRSPSPAVWKRRVAAVGDRVPAVVLTAREGAELAERADGSGPTAFLPKPFAYGELLGLIHRLLEA